MRQRCLVIINLILEKSKNVDIDEKLLQKISTTYLERSRDKVISVRSAAATGLCLLQHIDESNTTLLKVIAQNMRYEANTAIRHIYASSIRIHPLTMDGILLRMRDDDLTIRLAIIKNLEEHSTVQQLSQPLRHAAVHCLQDRNEVIVKSAESLIASWAKQTSLLPLLSLFDLEKEEVIVQSSPSSHD